MHRGRIGRRPWKTAANQASPGNLNGIGRGSSGHVVSGFHGSGTAAHGPSRVRRWTMRRRPCYGWANPAALTWGRAVGGQGMPGKPYVVVTRKLPDSVETRMMELFRV